VKTGFVDASIETLVQWIAVEEDLASSYEKISATADSKEFRETADKLRAESLEMQKVLGQMVKELDNLDKESVKRIERLQRLLS
jgi:hypothetical protein